MNGPPDSDVPKPARDLESTAELLALARQGDRGAANRLMGRYLPVLSTLAHGRLPRGARDLVDTDDLVQQTLLRAFKQLERFEPRREGAFLAYLRQILINQIRDQARRMARSPDREALTDDLADGGRTPLDNALGRDGVEIFEAGLAKLSDEQREAVILRVELGYSYDEMASAMGKPSANAVRMLVARALVRLSEVMTDPRTER